MDFELTAEQAALRARARELADGVFAERAARCRPLPPERMMRDARMFAIGGGTLEMMRNVIADGLLPRVSWRPLA